MTETTLMMDGILPVNKPRDITSYDVIRILKRRAGRAKFFKIGHAGTLDPMAEGVLLILLGRATGLFDKINGMRKTYTAEFVFGIETDTDDVTGRVMRRSDARPTRTEAEVLLSSFTGEIDQVPPQYSAVKHKGRKLYEYAREGMHVEMPSRKVNVYSIEMLSFSRDSMILRVECSGGTYIRALARDFGRKAGSFAALSSLKRDKIGAFDISMCVGMDRIEKEPLKDLIIDINEKSNNARFF